MSDEHVCDWARTLGGTIRCAICGEPMSQTDEQRRLNATERLSAERVREILEDRNVTTGDILALKAYADAREGRKA